MRKLAIITTHPIQYYAPVFQMLHQHKRIEIKVFYTWGEAALKKHDPGFGKTIDWDVPLLDRYPYEWVKNTSKNPGSHSFMGIINPDLIGQINLWEPDALLIFGWAYHSHLKAMRYFKNKMPVYFRGDSTLFDEEKGVRSFLKTRLLKWVYSHVDYAFFVGTNNKAYFKKYGLKDKQLIFAPHAIDNERFAIDRTPEVIELKQSLGIPLKDIIILFAGKLEEKKSPLLLLDAFLALNYADVHLLFVGNGNLEAALHDKAGMHQNIHFINFQNQRFMPVIYQACNVFCLPSNGPGESWGLAVNEAMACSKAILVSDKCGCAIDLVTKDNGLIFGSGQTHELISVLKNLILKPELINEFGKRSEILIQNWNFKHITDTIEKTVAFTTG